MKALKIALLVLLLGGLLVGVSSRLFLAFTPPWLDMAIGGYTLISLIILLFLSRSK
jgi:hypothetical protein